MNAIRVSEHMGGLRNGTLRTVIGQERPLAQVARAREAVMEPSHHGKIVLVPSGGSGANR